MVYLEGDLGAGKTTLVRGFLRALGYDGPVRSPTYTLVEPYEFLQLRVYHMDLYRLADPEELEFLGIRDFLDADTLCLVEWPERGRGLLAPPDLTLRIEYTDSGRRVFLLPASPRGRAILARAALIVA